MCIAEIMKPSADEALRAFVLRNALSVCTPEILMIDKRLRLKNPGYSFKLRRTTREIKRCRSQRDRQIKIQG